MMSNITESVLKSQRVMRRKNGYTIQGNTALKNWEQVHQSPVHKKRLPPPRQKPESPDYRYAEEEADSAYAYTSAPNTVKKPFPPQVIIFGLCFIAMCVFSYYALLWRDEGITINPEAEAYTRKKMLAYALGAKPSHIQESEQLPVAVNEVFSWNNYTVKKGDSVSKIAADHALSLDAVIASNNLQNARLLREGEILRIPNMDGIPYTVVKGDTYQKIADKTNVAMEAILDANDIQDDSINTGDILFLPGAKMRSDDLKMALGELFMYPVRGRLSSSFGWRKDPFTGQRRYHNAIDISANTGTPIKAAADGTVTTAAYSSVFGNYIILTHSGGFQSMYAHLNSTSVKTGARVSQGDSIGQVGSTGRSTGPHLHFAIYKNGRAVNPLEYVKH